MTTEPTPAGLAVALDGATTELSQGVVVGGSPRRLMRLTPAGRDAYQEIKSGQPQSSRARLLARRLIDAGLAHPRPQPSADLSSTVVIPVRDRPTELAACLAALGHDHAVVVVDDGSADPAAVAAVVAAHGAQLIRHRRSRGPAAARNTALAAIDSDVIAFIDSDCVAPPGWIAALSGHLRDPLVAVAAPRIVPITQDTGARRFAGAAGSLDLGRHEARVVPLSPVGYVPTAALVVRRAALLDVTRGGRVFDESMRYGEDVDLIWRLHQSGWRIRFDPTVEVAHHEPARWRELLVRRFHYGTSAAPLALRHPGLTAPVVLTPLAAATVAAGVARRPLLAGALVVAGVRRTRRAMASANIAGLDPVTTNLRLVGAQWIGIGRYAVRFAAPAVAAAAMTGPRRTRRHRLASVVLLAAAPAVHAWLTRRPRLNLASFVVASTADDLAYGAGVWAGALRHRTIAPLRPSLLTAKDRANG